MNSYDKLDEVDEIKRISIMGFTTALIGTGLSTMTALFYSFSFIELSGLILLGSFSIVLTLAAIFICIKALRKIRNKREEYNGKGLHKGLAISGIVLSILTVLGWLLFISALYSYG